MTGPPPGPGRFKFIQGGGGSFQSIPIHSNTVLLMGVGSAGEYESFEHVQKLCVVSADKFHSCLCALKTCSYRVCRTAYILWTFSLYSYCILVVLTVYVYVGQTGASYEWTRRQ